jgi:hypothetical protein
MPEHNRQVNVHLVGNHAEGVVEELAAKLDCNTINFHFDLRERLNWLVNNANLVVLLPGWKDSSTCLTEIAVARELAIETVFLHEVLPGQKKAGVFIQDLLDHLAGHGVHVKLVNLDEKLRGPRG